MKDNIYTIKKLCEELSQPRQKIRRRLINLDIKAINQDTRIYKNEPLEYDYQAFLKLAEEFDVEINNRECTASVQHRTTENATNEQHSTVENKDKDRLINVLEKQLEEANKSRANLEKLLDQQQQLTLISNKKLESLKLQIEEKELEKQVDDKINKEEKFKWFDFFRRKRN